MERTDEVARAAKDLIMNFSLRKCPGENVTYAHSRMIAVATMLDQSNQLISDHYDAIQRGLCDCSLPEFRLIFESLKALDAHDIYNTQGAMAGKTVLEKIEHLFEIGERKYRQLYNSDKWPGKGDDSSSFSVANSLGPC